MTETTEKLESEQIASAPEGNIPHLQKDASYFTKKRGKKKKFFLMLIVLLVIVGAAYLFMPKSSARPVGMLPLTRQNLVNQIGVTGVVKSANESRVYTDLNGLTVQKINVKVGDRVKEGDLLAQLDTADLELEIAKLQANMSQQERLNALNIEQAKQEYDQLSSDLKIEMDSQVVSAKQLLDSAQRELADARIDMKEHQDDLDHADDMMYDVEKRLNRARDAWQDAQKKLDEIKRDKGENSSEYQEAAVKTEKLLTEYETVLKEWEEKDRAYGGDLNTYSKAYRRARLSYESALDNYKIAKENAQRRLSNAKDTIEKAQISSEMTAEQITLRQNSKKIAESKITAPISGTVTAVYVKEGEPVGPGMMFIIEDTDNLVVKTAIREFDIANIKEGMSTIVKTDATGDQTFEGKISRISPTAMKDLNGNIDSSGNVEFETDVALDAQKSGLRVGMNARVDVILEKRENVFAVPFEALASNENGEPIVYAARPDAEGVMRAEPILVELGLETDFNVEISGEGLAEGENIIADATLIMPNLEVMPMPTAGVGTVGTVTE